MRTQGYKALIAGVTAAVCGGLLVWAYGLRTGPGLPRLPDAASIEGTELDEATAFRLLPYLEANDRLVYDPVAIVAGRPHVRERYEWPEHPDGHVVLAHDGLGLREDRTPGPKGDARRVVVLGDSQTYGIVHNHESFANLLEARLREATGRPHDVVNAGVSSTGPDEYLGNMRRLLSLDPDLFVVVLYTGNDFASLLRFDAFRTKRPAPRYPPEARKRYERAARDYKRLMSQGAQQAFALTRLPGQAERAAALAVERFEEMAALCEAEGVGLAVVLLPSKIDVDDDHAEVVDAMLSALGMTRSEYGRNLRLGRTVAAALRARGLPVLDPTQAMAADPRPLFWRRDHHLNVDGNALLAELIEEPVHRLLSAGGEGAEKAGAGEGGASR